MDGNWILSPALQCGFQIAGLLLCVYLFFSIKREARRDGLRSARDQQGIQDDMDALKKEVEQIRAEFGELSERSATLVEPPPAASGLNLTKRSQALRMHRRGEALDKIAAALMVPEREVELLLKVDELTAGKS